MSTEQEKKSASLHYWYVYDKDGHRRACGNITGHEDHNDGTDVRTSEVEDIVIDYSKGEAVITTKHTIYRCPLEYCAFEKQDKYPDIIPNYESMKSLYRNKVIQPEIENGKILLVLSNFNEHYFNSLCIKDENGEKYKYIHRIHLGMVQDSVLINLINERLFTPLVSLSYFPFFNFIEFYHTRLAGLPLYVENIGTSILEIRILGNNFSVRPKERIQVV